MESPNWNRFGHFIERIKEQSLLFQSFSVFHMRREANLASHLLTKAVFTQVLDNVWLENFLHFLFDIVFKEATTPFFLNPFKCFCNGFLSMKYDKIVQKKKKKKQKKKKNDDSCP